MKRLCVTILLCLSCVTAARADYVKVGSPAPQFTLTSAKGSPVSLKDFIGKTVVLEWFNPNCPFVRKFYSNGDMQRFQKEAIEKGVVWLTINSNAEGKQGYIPSSEAATLVSEMGLQSTALLLDPDGTVGTSFGARITPHMFVIDSKGNVAYQGAIDSTPSTRSNDIPSSTNYVLTAIEALRQGKNPSPADTEPYGCSVKYASK